ncbi:MAG: sensor histidine kinase [Rubrivivax sp.]
MTPPPSMPSAPSPYGSPGAGGPGSRWRRFADACVVAFHRYASWLVTISWLRFFVLAVLLMIAASILKSIPPFSWRISEVVESPPPAPKKPAPPATPKPPREPVIKIEKPQPGTRPEGVDISIDERGIRIRPRAASAPAPGASAPAATQGARAASSAASSSASTSVWQEIKRGAQDGWKEGEPPQIVITVPPGSDSDGVRQAVREAEQAIREAMQEAREAREEAQLAQLEAEQAASDTFHTRIRVVKFGEFLTDLALLWILASIVIKITYKGRIQAEVKAARAAETAEAESLKRQVVEARMAAMQAQVEPHFLFNTLASIEHLIETDPKRAAQMQRNLIALLRASMPTMREANHGSPRHLGRELEVIRPYLEILKVRMEERLSTAIEIPEGLLSAEFPPMMIQTLVENAIKHGLEPKPEGGTLSVRAEIVHGKLAVSVADTGLGFAAAPTAGTGVGLANIRERLQLLYGGSASLTVAANQPCGTVVTVSVPYRSLEGAAE